MNIVKRAFSISTEEYELRRKGKVPKKSLEQFLKELDLDLDMNMNRNNND